MSAGILLLGLMLIIASPVSADTGTYGISNYIVTLEPQSSGQVKITIEQQWKVLSGNIPWVTVGLPNNSYSIENYSGSASKVSSANGSGFSGVKVDLDRDYQPGQTFSIKFTVLQSNLLERLTADEKWRINYTPGWYDKATIDHLQINLVSPVDYQTYSSMSPMPTGVNNNIITWDRTDHSPGSRFNIVIESYDGSFLSASTPSTSSHGGFGTTFYIIVAIILIIGFLVFWSIRKNRQARDAEVKQRVATIQEEMDKDRKKKEEVEEGFAKYVEDKNIQPDTQGRYYDRGFGDYITPAIWWAILANQYSHQQNNLNLNKPSHPSCACACVSCACACACACAGGGAAGCAPKTLHECREYRVSREKADTISKLKE
jgi:hypothetical protein